MIDNGYNARSPRTNNQQDGIRFMTRIIIALLFFSAGSVASERQGFCTQMQQIARAAMTARQAGVPLQTMLQLVSDDTAIGIFRESYQYPKHDSEADRKGSVENFSELVLSECLKA